jgi:class 3 adenylate cyclase
MAHRLTRGHRPLQAKHGQQDAPVRMLGWWYRKLGPRYPIAFVAVELLTAFVITGATIGLLSFYYDASLHDYLLLLGIGLVLTAMGVTTAVIRTAPRLAPLNEWIAGRRDEEAAAKAWATAIGLPLEMIKAERKIPVIFVVIPASIATLVVLGLSWLAIFPLVAAGMVSLGYSMILHYLAVETGMRPILIEINREMTPRFLTGVRVIPLRTRMLVALPLINVITGLVVAALTSGGGGGAALGGDVLVAVGVATTISLELTVMFTRSILRPIRDLQTATEAVRRGDYQISIPLTTADELGELAASFNEMVAGLAEREKIREAFGTYLDHEVADYILSEGFSEEGVEMEVSILFLDVRDFTSFAAQADAKQVVAELNHLFEIAVPVIARHGGHVDKFVGDGLMAVFGAPEPFADHANRAVRAACEMVSKINDPDREGLRVGVGINTGTVVAGSIGGAGRLNFSVIGDPVNVASRVEAATRDLDCDVLITAATAEALGGTIQATACGRHDLKGLTKPVELYTPSLTPAEPGEVSRDYDEPLSIPGGDGVVSGREAITRHGGGGLL